MILNYILHNKNSKKYENKIGKVKKDELSSLKSCIENVSITFILFGSIIIMINLLANIFFIGNSTFSSVYKLYSITSGLWLIIVIAQVLSFLFSSTFFENSTHLFLNNEKKNKGHKWNPLSTAIFLTNVTAFSCVSILSFYGIFSCMINVFNITNGRMLATTVFSFSVNLMFLVLQFLYILLKIHRIKNIKFNNYMPLFLPGFSCLIESTIMNIKSKIKESLLDEKSKKKKLKQKNKDYILHQDENLYLIN
ncbi:conserved Plasmodium protein, unknown function [Plasmodium malariae]|uniref:Uncharacterized protein n=1 Tax=Plasmodium malariae TaxID=5858 RepID=A0A1D3SME2_PLAMA|nr:conserved Plasmodium protein, unknown function [Plasmodium malariae]SCO92997.1 conserved Plasmodium protein, unknown function [Plasmodium malariae]